MDLTIFGLTDIVVGPFSNDVYIASDGTSTASAGRVMAYGYLE